MVNKKVVVIGSGIGGSGVAALLQHRGFNVTLLEKNKFFGGKCYGYDRDGFIVDSGVHMYSRGHNGPLSEISRQVGGNLKWLKKGKAVTFRFGNQYDTHYYQPAFDLRTYLEMAHVSSMAKRGKARGALLEGNSTKRVKGLSNALYQKLNLGSSPIALFRLIAKLWACDEKLISDLDEMSARDFLYTFTDNMLLHQFISFVSMIFFCTTYDRVSAGELLWCYIQQMKANGLGVPEGGSRSLPADYLNCMNRDGGKLVLGAKVKKIKVSGGKVKSVVTEDGKEYGADYVISNAGIKLTVDMAGEKNFPAEYIKRVKGLEYSYSFITIKYGLSKRVIDPGTPSWFNIPNLQPDKMYDYLRTGEAPEDPHLFVPMQSEWDSTAAPKGKQLLVVGVLGPVNAGAKEKAHCKKILDRAEEVFAGEFPGFQNYVEWSARTDNNYYSQITGKPTGDCIGLAQNVGQTGIHKPSPKMPIEGLYLVGSDGGARGVGTEQAAGSALYVADLIK